VRHVLGIDLAVVGGIGDQKGHLNDAVERGSGRLQDRFHVLQGLPRLLGRRPGRGLAADVIARTGPRHEDQACRPRRAREGTGSRRVRRIEELDHG
jgi:hypothetical protein